MFLSNKMILDSRELQRAISGPLLNTIFPRNEMSFTETLWVQVKDITLDL